MATVVGIPVALRFIASSSETITVVAVEIPVEPFGGVSPTTAGARESITGTVCTADPRFPAGSTTVTFTEVDVELTTGRVHETEWGLDAPWIGPATGLQGPHVASLIHAWKDLKGSG